MLVTVDVWVKTLLRLRQDLDNKFQLKGVGNNVFFLTPDRVNMVRNLLLENDWRLILINKLQS